MAIEILEPAWLTTVQDAGRRGWQAFGVPVSGPMDAFALRAANRLAGNPPDAAALEIGLTSATLCAHADCLIAAAGAGYELFVNDWRMPLWNAVVARRGWIIRLERSGPGNWAYLAVHGGIRTPAVFGSRATCASLRFGHFPRPGLAGDLLPIGPAISPFDLLAGRALPPERRPPYAVDVTARVVRGPQFERFPSQARETFFRATYRIRRESDRMGYRLTGPAIESDGGELLSEGMARGCVQIPPGGEPIVMQADSPTAGGYPKIAAVISADQPLLAQAPIGSGSVRFVEVDVASARHALLVQVADLESGITHPEREDLWWSAAC